MKKLMTTIWLLLAATLGLQAANKSWTLAQSTYTSSLPETVWNFSNGFTISNSSDKAYSTGSENGIKYSAGIKYTISIPAGETVKRVTFTGYDNYGETDAYIRELGGTTFITDKYVFPQKDANNNYTVKSYTIELDAPATGTLTFTPAGKQVVWAITLYNYTETEQQQTIVSGMEQLDRGLVALPGQGGGIFVSWRLLGTDNPATVFDLYRNNSLIAEGLSTVTNYTDRSGSTTSRYRVVARNGNETLDSSDEVSPWDKVYLPLQLDLPADGKIGNEAYTYSPNDCSAGDVDGDGQYEIIVKWDPSNAKDNSQSGKTGNVLLDCYTLGGKKLWRIDLGPNIRAGAHYTQFLVYDFDGDGRAELICKTAPGSKGGDGKYVSAAADDTNISGTDNSKDYRNSNGYVLSGPEYLTVFDGRTGRAIHTVYYNPNRNFGVGGSASYSSSWGDSYGNRGDRFLAAVAYLDGADKRPSAVMCRGYYTRAYLWAVGFDGSRLSTKWLHASTSKTAYSVTDASGSMTNYTASSCTSGDKGVKSYTMYSNGNHNLSVGDVDGDGCDEIIWGSAALDNDGRLLYAVGHGHGDAIHLGDLDPDRPGLELFDIHEEKKTYSWDLHDAATGQIIFQGGNSGVDNGRGLAADIDADNRGSEFWSSDERNERNAQTGEVVGTNSVSVNFRVYWDGDLQDELLDGTKLDKWNGNGAGRLMTFYNYGSSSSCNGTKQTPNLQADLFGDWREEVILWDASNRATLNIFTTNIPSDYRVTTLMHDHVYRMGVAWQQTAYNQPPHLGYYLPSLFEEKPSSMKFSIAEGSTLLQDATFTQPIVPVVFNYADCTVGLNTELPDGLTATDADGTFTISGIPAASGRYEIGISATGDGKTVSRTVVINVKLTETIKLYSEDYESVNSVGERWAATFATEFLTLEEDNTRYVRYAPSGQSGGRSAYTEFKSLDLTGLSAYTLEFDASLHSTNENPCELAVMALGGKTDDQRNMYTANNDNKHYLLALRGGAKYSTSYTVNGDEARTVVIPDGVMCHYTLQVDGEAGTVSYKIVNLSTEQTIADATLSMPGDTDYRVRGLYFHCGRSYFGEGKFDNIVVTAERRYYVPGDVNGDYKSDIADVTMLIGMLKGDIPADIIAGDKDGDHRLTNADLEAVVKVLLEQ